MEFCKAFNAKTQDQKGTIIPVIITVYSDRSFTFITKTPPAFSSPEGSEDREGKRHPQQDQGGEGDQEAARGNRQSEAAGPHCRFDRGCHEYRGRNG